ncbi:MAG TPA: hypothetical protein PKX00_05370 [Opitutaceae bacterium]|nr:hypothetical protein [Opitutaceae bacterium]
MFDPDQILSHYNPATGELAGAKPTERYLTDLRGSFADAEAYEAALAVGNPLLYRVGGVAPATGEGDLRHEVIQDQLTAKATCTMVSAALCRAKLAMNTI